VLFSDLEAARANQDFVTAHGLHVERGDIVDGARIRDVAVKEKPDAVVHLAALTGVARCNENPSLAFSVNVFGTYNVLMACVASKSKLVFISSREVYGETVSNRAAEDSPLVPNNLYGLTKMLGETIVWWGASKYGLDYTILRLTSVYGPEGDQYNVQAMIKKALTRGTIQVSGGSQQVNLLHVEDAAEVILRCLTDPRTSRQIFNVGSKDDMKIDDVVSQLVSLLDAPVRIEHQPMRVGETVNFRPDLERIERTLGYWCRTGFSEGLQKTINWYKDRVFKKDE
jgi:nucleoside-diphosphate-sugar epimerase